MTPDDLRKLAIGTVHRVKWDNSDGLLPSFGYMAVNSGTYDFKWEGGGPIVTLTDDLESPVGDLECREWLMRVKIVQPRALITFSAVLPPDCEATGEFRQPDPAVDSYLHQDGVTVIHPRKSPNGNTAPKGPRIILKRKLTAKERLEELRVTASSLPVIRMEIEEILKLM